MEQTDTEKVSSTEMDGAGLEDFLTTGRTGRRNAVPDILDPEKASVSTGSLPFEMEKLSCSDSGKGASGSSNNTGAGQGS